MIWTRPWALWFLVLPVVLVALSVVYFRWKKKALASWGDRSVIHRLLDPWSGRRQRVKAVLEVLAIFFLVVALAGPRWGRLYQEVQRRGVDVMVAVDVSSSMLAEDIAPNRLTQAKRELSRLLAGLEGDRVGLTAFAGTAILQCPLTLDYGAALSLLDLMDPELVPKPGTSLADALRTSVGAFPEGTKKYRALVLLTDGEDHSGRLDEAVQEAVKEGVRIFPIGYGSPEGDLIPLRAEDGRLLGYKTDQAGKNVTSRLDETALRSMATATGGMYFRATDGEVEVVRLLAEINGMEKKNLESRVWGQTEDHYSIPLLIGLLLLFLEFLWPETSGHVGRVVRDLRSLWSKKSVAALFLVFSFFPTAGYSLGRLSPLARGARAVEKNPNDPVAHDRLAHALYADNNFATAAESFGRAQGLTSNETQKIEAAYNTGNALFQQGKLKEAVEKYKEVLHKNPADLDAKYNLEMAQRLLKTQPPQKDNKNKKDDENKKDDKNKDQESDGKKSGSDKKEESDQKPKPGEMSKEDAERLLQAVEAQEKEAQRDANKKNPPAESNGVDW